MYMWVDLGPNASHSVGGVSEHVEAFALGMGIGLGSTCLRWDRHVDVGLDVFALGPRCAGVVMRTGA